MKMVGPLKSVRAGVSCNFFFLFPFFLGFVSNAEEMSDFCITSLIGTRGLGGSKFEGSEAEVGGGRGGRLRRAEEGGKRGGGRSGTESRRRDRKLERAWRSMERSQPPSRTEKCSIPPFCVSFQLRR